MFCIYYMYLHRYKTTISCIIILFIFILYTISCVCCSFSTPHPFAPTIYRVCLCPYHSILCRYYILYSMYLLPLYLVPRSSSPLRPSSACILHSAQHTGRQSRPYFSPARAAFSRCFRSVYKSTLADPFSCHLAHFTISRTLQLVQTTISCGFKQSDEFVHFAQISQVQYLVVDYAQLHNISPCLEKREICCLSCAVRLPV